MSGGRGRGGQGGLELSDLGGGSGVRANEVPGTECLEKGRMWTKGVLRDISQEKRRPRNESPCFAIILRGMASRRASERGVLIFPYGAFHGTSIRILTWKPYSIGASHFLDDMEPGSQRIVLLSFFGEDLGTRGCTAFAWCWRVLGFIFIHG